jgi:hypothetical protein
LPLPFPGQVGLGLGEGLAEGLGVAVAEGLGLAVGAGLGTVYEHGAAGAAESAVAVTTPSSRWLSTDGLLRTEPGPRAGCDGCAAA